jgi:glutaredoxin
MLFPAVDLYTKPGSEECDRVREYLVRDEVPFTEHDIAADADARGRLMWLTGRLWVPTLVVEDAAIVGFDRTKFDELFEDIRERMAQANER